MNRSASMFPCNYCKSTFPSQQRLLAHLTNSPPCKAKWDEFIVNISSTLTAQVADPPDEDVNMDDSAAVSEPLFDFDSNMLEAGKDLYEEGGEDFDGEEDFDDDGGGEFDEEESDRDFEEEGSVSTSSDRVSVGEESGSRIDDEEIDDPELGAVIDGPPILASPRNISTFNATQRGVPPPLTEPLEKSEDLYTEIHPCAGRIFARRERSLIDELQTIRGDGQGNIYYPFANDIDFELAVWLSSSGLSRAKIDEFLKLKYVGSLSPPQ